MILDLDFGNSSIKWQLTDSASSQQLARGKAQSLEVVIEQLMVQELQPRSSRISLVNSRKKHAQSYRQLLQQAFACQVYFAEVTGQQAGLRNGYRNPERLGVDRWLAMLAGWQRYQQALMVIDAGTAITVDLITADGEHLGGCIAPGLQLLKEGLSAGSGLDLPSSELAEPYGQDTADCMAVGVSCMFDAFILRQCELAKDSLGKGYKTLVTGGDASRVAQLLAADWCCPDLVLHGLAVSIPLEEDQ